MGDPQWSDPSAGIHSRRVGHVFGVLLEIEAVGLLLEPGFRIGMAGLVRIK